MNDPISIVLFIAFGTDHLFFFQRLAVFKWTAGIVAMIPIQILQPLLFHLMSPLVREMITTEESNAPLRQLAKEVSGMIKKKMDREEYVKLLSTIQQKIDTRKAERKKSRKQQVCWFMY